MSLFFSRLTAPNSDKHPVYRSFWLVEDAMYQASSSRSQRLKIQNRTDVSEEIAELRRPSQADANEPRYTSQNQEAVWSWDLLWRWYRVFRSVNQACLR